MTNLSTLSATDLAELRAANREKLDATKEPATEAPDAPPLHTPGALFFLDGKYVAVSGNISDAWPTAEWWIDGLLALAPRKHRLEYWRERFESGHTLLTLFFGSDGHIEGAGLINCELNDFGIPVTYVATQTFRPIDLSHVAKIGEVVAHQTDCAAVCLWTPTEVPMVPGFQLDNCWFGQMQVLFTADLPAELTGAKS